MATTRAKKRSAARRRKPLPTLAEMKAKIERELDDATRCACSTNCRAFESGWEGALKWVLTEMTGVVHA